MPPRHVVVQGVRIPTMLYGTAWKEERTEPLVREALAAGFRGVDTANQRKHYHEAGVGAALRRSFAAGLARDDVFVQTKFTFARGQDHRLPYDPSAPIGDQVARSCASSLEHLGVDRLDAYVLHGPSSPHGWGPEDRAAWRAMEALHEEGRARLLGVSNVSTAQLEALLAEARVKPAVVQNRAPVYPQADRATRELCRAHGMAYEGFSLLTAAPMLLRHPTVAEVAARLGRTPAEVVLRLWLEAGVVVLTGTTSREHMAQDLSIHDAELADEDLARLLALVP